MKKLAIPAKTRPAKTRQMKQIERGEIATISPKLKALLEGSDESTTQLQSPDPAPAFGTQEVRFNLD